MTRLAAPTPQARTYRAVWRWHFYAGLFCIPFILWLSVTGSIYLFKPQLDALIDRPYGGLAFAGARASALAQVDAALAAVPGSTLTAYQLPQATHAAVQILVGRDLAVYRVFVHPKTLAILKVIPEERRFTQRISHLHGELLLGDRGSMIVELAASWAIVMFLSGFYLWWPRNAQGLAGVAYPRLIRGRIFWRDLHGVTGFYVSAFALFFLISGLPWTSSWGGLFKSVREFRARAPVVQTWPTGSSSELARRGTTNAMSDMPGMAGMSGSRGGAKTADAKRVDLAPIDKLVPVVARLDLAFPVLIAPPSPATSMSTWTARSDAQNRPLRVDIVLDDAAGAVRSRSGFAQLPLLDRAVAVGVAAHEGQLFSPLNQVVGALTAFALVIVCVSAIVLWWSRRTAGVLGAPRALGRQRTAPVLVAGIVALGFVLPLLGASLVLVLLVERTILRRIPRIRDFLGLEPVAA